MISQTLQTAIQPAVKKERRVARVAWSGTSLVNAPTGQTGSGGSTVTPYNSDYRACQIGMGPLTSGIAAAANGKFRTCANLGVGGSYTKNTIGIGINGASNYDWYDWQLPRLKAQKADFAPICIGTNDVKYTSILTSTQIAQYMSYIEDGCNQLLSVGTLPMLINLPPLRYNATYKATHTANVIQWNYALRKLAERIGVPYIDVYSLFALTTYEWVANTTTDSIHWNYASNNIWPKIWAQMSPYFTSSTGNMSCAALPRDFGYYDSYIQGWLNYPSEPYGWNNVYINNVQSANAAASSNGVYTSVYSAWNPTNFGAAGQSFIGPGIKDTVTSSASAASNSCYVSCGAYTGGNLTLPTAGTRMLLSGWFEITSNSTPGNMGVYHRFVYTLSNSTTHTVELFNTGAAAAATSGPFYLETEFVVPDMGLSSLGPFYLGTSSGCGGATTLVHCMAQVSVQTLDAIY